MLIHLHISEHHLRLTSAACPSFQVCDYGAGKRGPYGAQTRPLRLPLAVVVVRNRTARLASVQVRWGEQRLGRRHYWVNSRIELFNWPIESSCVEDLLGMKRREYIENKQMHFW